MKPIFELTPRQIVRALNSYIIGQDNAKKAVGIALRNRWRRYRIEDEIREEIIPNNILMIGPTGVGKSEIARRLAQLAGAPFVKVEASKFTEVGYVGRDVESMVRDLAEMAVAQVRAEWIEEVEDDAARQTEERLLDFLLPLPPKPRAKRSFALEDLLPPELKNRTNADESKVGEESSEYLERRNRTREKLRERLRDGKLDNHKVDIKLPERGTGMMQVFGPAGMEEMGINIQELFGGMLPKRNKPRTVTVSDARRLITAEEVDKLLDMDAVVTEALRRTEQLGIIFLDEIDKIAASEPGHGPDVSREGVQRDILPVIEGTRIATKYGPVRTDHILFIAAGAFHVAKPSDMIPELQGRFPIRVELDALETNDFIRILTEPKNALIKQYTALLAAEGVELQFDKSAIREVAQFAAKINERTENIGARRLHTVMTTLLEEILFKVPSKTISEVKVTRKMVRERLADLAEDEDLSRYIL